MYGIPSLRMVEHELEACRRRHAGPGSPEPDARRRELAQPRELEPSRASDRTAACARHAASPWK